MTFGEKTTAAEIVEAYQDSVKGKNVVITGVRTNGIGAAAVEALAPYAKTIIVASRSVEKAEEAVASARKAVPTVDIRVVPLDLSSGDSIRAAAKKIIDFKLPIHVLINNAAVEAGETLERTKEGFEKQIGVDHFGHFLFTSLLFPSILQAKSEDWKPRIVNLSSNAAFFGGQQRFDDIHYTARPEEYSRFGVYGQAKTANALFSIGVADRYGDAGVLSYSVHPGVVRGTVLGGSVSDEELKAFGIIKPDGTPTLYFKTIPEGASTTLFGAFDPSITSQNGAFLADADIYRNPLPDYLTSSVEASKLWTISEEAWKIKFGA